MIGRSTFLELAQGFGLVTPDPFSSRELGGVWARDYMLRGIGLMDAYLVTPEPEKPTSGNVRLDSGAFLTSMELFEPANQIVACPIIRAAH